MLRREGAGQFVLVGPPNAGKSALHARLTGSYADVEPYPFTTQIPQPGMLCFEDIAFQLIDLPPVSSRHPVPWLAHAPQPADGCLLVVDLGDPACVEQTAELVHKELAEELRYARLCRDGIEGRQVGPGHPLEDGDVLELHR